MKKKNLKSLKLNKESVSIFIINKINGGLPTTGQSTLAPQPPIDFTEVDCDLLSIPYSNCA